VLGLLLPWLLARFGTNPAFGSGPAATIMTIAIYFAVMATVINV
jgi:magnesium transporter